jgi:hypothetical protein
VLADLAPLGGVALIRAGHQAEIVRRVLVGVEESSATFLADRVDGRRRAEAPPLCVIVLLWPSDQAEVLIGDLVGIEEPAVDLLPNGVRPSCGLIPGGGGCRMPARRLKATTSWSAQGQPVAILMTVRRPRWMIRAVV